MRVMIFGDSITQGFWDAYGGWVQRLAHEYHQKSLSAMLGSEGQFVEIFNLGVDGDGIEGVSKRLEPEVKARQLFDTGQDIIVIAIGLNDAILRDNRADIDVYEFQERLEEIIKKAFKLTDKVMCVGLTAVDESQTDPWPYSTTGKQWHNPRINAFEDTIKQSAERSDIPFVPIHDRFLAQLETGAQLLADGLHPNEAGHQLIAELVKPTLDSLITA